jgi:hypothetical protein
MTRAKPEGKKSSSQHPRLFIKPIAGTRDVQDMLEDTLDQLSKDLTDYTGRTISGSAVLLALIRYTRLQPYEWVLSQLAPLVEEEASADLL